MNSLLRKTTTIACSSILVVSSISTNKSNWSGMDLKPIEIENSVHFQQMRGSTRVGEFDNLRPTLNRFITKKYESRFLKNVLGTANKVLDESTTTNYHYYSLSDNANRYRLKLTIKNKLLQEYHIENSK